MKLPTLILAAVLAASVATALAEDASAAPDRLVLSRHGVVLHSSLPPCAVEDGSSGPVPCSWNFGAPSRDGLAFVVRRDGSFKYVWDGSPVLGRPHRSWRGDCWVSDHAPRTAWCLPGNKHHVVRP